MTNLEYQEVRSGGGLKPWPKLEKLTSVCAGCKKVPYQGPQPAEAATSHGVCLPCQTKVNYLDGDSIEDVTEFVDDMTEAGF